MRFGTTNSRMIILSEEQSVQMGKSFRKQKCGWGLNLNKTVLNILSNFIPHELIACDDKDPPWFNTKIKLIQEKIKTYQVPRTNTENNQQTEKLKSLQNGLK